MRKLVIPRAQVGGDRFLDGASGCRCPVGWYLKALGVPDDALEGVCALSVLDDLPQEADWLVKVFERQAIDGGVKEVRTATMEAARLFAASTTAMDAEDERVVIEVLGAHGVEVEFV